MATKTTVPAHDLPKTIQARVRPGLDTPELPLADIEAVETEAVETEAVETDAVETELDLPLVNGVPVIEVRPVRSNLPGRNGEAVMRKGVQELILQDGTSIQRCTDCGHLGSHGELMSHRSREHKPAGPEPRKPAKRGAAESRLSEAVTSMSLGEIIEMGASLNRISDLLEQRTRERDDYQQRCVDLERDLRIIKTNLRRAGFIREDDLVEGDVA